MPELLLPVVSQDTIASMTANYTSRENWGRHLEKVRRTLLLENPQLARFIELQVGQFPPQLHNQVFGAIIGTLVILEHQAKADRLSSLFSDNDSEKK